MHEQSGLIVQVAMTFQRQEYRKWNEQWLEYYSSIFVMLILTSGVPDPVFKNKKIYFPSAEAYYKHYSENISLTEQLEH